MNDDQNWRFDKFKNSSGGAHSPTLAVPSSSFARANFESQYGGNPTAAPARTNATSRIIPSPSNTNWNSTFVQNTPSSPSNTDWQKTFGGGGNSFVSQPATTPARNASPRDAGGFSFDLAPTDDRSQLSLPASDFQDRTANLDLTSRDHELYGAGPDYGFND